MPVRVPFLLLLAALALTVGLVVAGVGPWASPARPAAPATSPDQAAGHHPAAARDVPALKVLHEWDRRRAWAWARGDADALASLYVAGSTAGRADVALLRRYLRRGVTVPDLRMQVLRAAVLVDRPRRVVIRVTERLAAREAMLGARSVLLPHDVAQVHLVELRRVGREWRVATVR